MRIWPKDTIFSRMWGQSQPKPGSNTGNGSHKLARNAFEQCPAGCGGFDQDLKLRNYEIALPWPSNIARPLQHICEIRAHEAAKNVVQESAAGLYNLPPGIPTNKDKGSMKYKAVVAGQRRSLQIRVKFTSLMSGKTKAPPQSMTLIKR